MPPLGGPLGLRERPSGTPKRSQTKVVVVARAVTALGERLRKQRLLCGLGLRETAKRIDISPSYLSRIEAEDPTPPSEDVLRKLAGLLGDDLDVLLQLAGRLPEDIERIVLSDPSMPAFIRLARGRGYTGAELTKLLKETV